MRTGLGVLALTAPAMITPQMGITACPPHSPAQKAHGTPHSHSVKFSPPYGFQGPPKLSLGHRIYLLR